MGEKAVSFLGKGLGKTRSVSLYLRHFEHYLIWSTVFWSFLGLGACRWGLFPQDCDSAVEQVSMSHTLRHEAQIDQFFGHLGLETPKEVQSVLEAKIELARMSYSEGCRWRTDSATYLGILLLEHNDVEDSIRFLEVGIEDRSTRQGLLALAEAYSRVGRSEEAQFLENEAENKPQAFGFGPPEKRQRQTETD